MIARLVTLLLIVRRSLRQHALSTIVTVLSVSLACGLVMAVFSVSAQTRRAFTGGPAGFDAVLGARGSPLQLVLNTVFHLETSPGNIPWQLYQQVKNDERVELAIPYAVGDHYLGHRVVGTTEEIFTRFEYRAGEPLRVQPGGRTFDPRRREAVIGQTVAERTGLRVGATFHPSHGVAGERHGEQHDEEYVVVGVLEPTSSPADRVIWIPLEGVFRISGHVLRGGSGDGDGRSGSDVYRAKPGEAIPEEHKEVSAVMLKLKSPQAGFLLDQMINKQGKVATLAWPIGAVMAELFDKLGWVNRVLELVAYLVVVVAAAAILASLYNSMNERRRDLAILRALGARRRTVFTCIVLEAGAIAACGCAVGYLVYACILAAAQVIVRRQTGVVLDVFAFHPALVFAPALMIGVGAIAGLLPALKAYATDVATHLVPMS